MFICNIKGMSPNQINLMENIPNNLHMNVYYMLLLSYLFVTYIPKPNTFQ